jgi:hypothetical protein
MLIKPYWQLPKVTPPGGAVTATQEKDWIDQLQFL